MQMVVQQASALSIGTHHADGRAVVVSRGDTSVILTILICDLEPHRKPRPGGLQRVCQRT